MPTENRSSNTEIVNAPAAHDLASKVRETLDRQACPNAWMVTAYEAVVANFPQPAPQTHPDPIAWMVGTAIWWTKEEAERDAAETGLPIVGLGPMAGAAPAEQHQREPVALPARKVHKKGNSPMQNAKNSAWNACLDEIAKLGPLYTHADPGEVERCEARLHEVSSLCASVEQERDALRAQLAECEAMAAMIAEREWAEHAGTGPVSSKVESAFTQLHNDLHEAGEKLAERDALLREVLVGLWPSTPLAIKINAALSASAEPSAPVEIDERPEGCCCPPKGYNGLWAAGPCPVHQG